MEPLKPCPFCGGDPGVITGNSGIICSVFCAKHCAATTLEVWNRRAGISQETAEEMLEYLDQITHNGLPVSDDDCVYRVIAKAKAERDGK